MSDSAPALDSFFELNELDPTTVDRHVSHAFSDPSELDKFRARVADYAASPDADPLKVAITYIITNRFTEALEKLEAVPPANGLRDLYRAQALYGQGRYQDSIDALAAAAKAGWDQLDADMRAVVSLVRLREMDEAAKRVKAHEASGAERSMWYFGRGLVAEYNDQRLEAVADYERALDLEPHQPEATFQLAFLMDMLGQDERAIELYTQLAARPRTHANALINLAVVFEDIGRFQEAARCLRRVLRLNPNHTRARLFLKDVESSLEMVIDETHDAQADARSRILDAPISEFELSVRARNCLKKMNIHTVGQLVQLGEAELLAYKNFGEASLNEIRELLAKKGLRLGQRPEEITAEQLVTEDQPAAPVAAPVGAGAVDIPPGREALLAKPVAELELSVRSRRCLQRLNIVTVGDVVQRTETDLLTTRNFGVTSLNEIKARLAELGLSLAPKSMA